MGQEQWIENAEKNMNFFRNIGKGAEAARLLEISPTNRILVDRDQAVLLMVVRLMAGRFGSYYPDTDQYKWINDEDDMIEEHQLTIEGKSRLQFMQTAIAQVQNTMNRVKHEAEVLTK